jgi:hypothetical protein
MSMRKETSIYLIRPSERKDEAFLFLALSSSEGARGNIFSEGMESVSMEKEYAVNWYSVMQHPWVLLGDFCCLEAWEGFLGNESFEGFSWILYGLVLSTCTLHFPPPLQDPASIS